MLIVQYSVPSAGIPYDRANHYNVLAYIKDNIIYTVAPSIKGSPAGSWVNPRAYYLTNFRLELTY